MRHPLTVGPFGTPGIARVGYARVSVREQNVEMQTDLLAEVGCEKVFIAKVSGKPRPPPPLG